MGGWQRVTKAFMSDLAAELRARIDRLLLSEQVSDTDVACWTGYLAALIEWGQLTPSDHHDLIDMLPPLTPDPAVRILLGKEPSGNE